MNIYDFSVKDTKGNLVHLEDYKGKVLLIVNTATRCGLTPQYNALQDLYTQYKNQGFEILDFPCNQFREQAPENGIEIEQVCQMKFGVKFKIFDKIDVNGEHASPLYVYLKSQKPEDKSSHIFKDLLLKLAALGEKREGGDIRWNFTKFLINQKGEVVERFAPSVAPSEIVDDIQALL